MNVIVILCIIIILAIVFGFYLYKNKNYQIESEYIKGFLSKYQNNSSSPAVNFLNNPGSSAVNFLKNPPSSAVNFLKNPGSSSKNSTNNPTNNPNSIQSGVDKTLQIFKNVFSDPKLYIAISIDIVLRELVKKTVDKIAQKTVAKLAFRAEEFFLKTTAKVLEKMGLDKGGEYLARLGLKAGEKAGQKAIEELALKSAAKGGGQLATQSAAAASSGPAFPFLEAAMLAFDVLSISLDLTDALIPGGTTGYAKMGTLQQYQEIRDEITKEMKKAFDDQGRTFPSVVGPLDKLAADDYKDKLILQIKLIMDTNANPVDTLIKPMIQKITEDILSKKLLESDTDDDMKMAVYNNLLDLDKISQKATSNLCTSLKGKNVDTGNGNMMCSYPDRNTCESSYSWPLKEDETYAEYKNEVYGGSCVASSYALRAICQTNNLPYDSETGVCAIDEKYCKSKGADWVYNDNIKSFDCAINKSQDIAELILGTTIVRGLKQIFDPDQYEKCDKPGQIDNPYTCSSCNSDEDSNKDLNTLASVTSGIAGIGLALTGALNMCYPKCKDGFHAFGSNICSPNCENGYTDDGAFCRKAGVCPEDNMDHLGGLCYPKCKDGFHAVGTNICSPNCEDGYTDDGEFCRKAGVCPDNMDHDAALCYPQCSNNYTGVGPVCFQNCLDEFTDIGALCSKGGDVYAKSSRPADKSGCNNGQRDDGTSCWNDSYGRGVGRVPDYEGCNDDYNTFPLTCTRKGCGGHYNYSWGGANTQCWDGGRAGWGRGDCYRTWISTCWNDGNGGHGIDTYSRNAKCNDDEEINLGLCYPKCKNGFHSIGCCVCAPDGHDGGFISKTLQQRQSCDDDENNIAGICWKKCKDEYHDDGAFCRKDIQTIAKKSYGRGVGIPDTIIKAKSSSYGRGFGVPDTIIKAKPNTEYARGLGRLAQTTLKKRVVPFSTKNN